MAAATDVRTRDDEYEKDKLLNFCRKVTVFLETMEAAGAAVVVVVAAVAVSEVAASFCCGTVAALVAVLAVNL